MEGEIKMITINQELYNKMPEEVRSCFNKLPNPSSEEVRECFPNTAKGSDKPRNRNTLGSFGMPNDTTPEYSDSGNASRFFKSIIYQAKSSKAERNAGCEGLEEKSNMRVNAPRENEEEKTANKMGNNHPTVKPIALMEYLIKMITPKGGIVLDPFGGSGTTAVAALQTGNDFIIIEKQPEYIEIIRARIAGFIKNKIGNE